MLARRLLQLYAGLALYGASAGLIILSELGNDPWDVLHQGLSRQTGIGTGLWVCIAGALVMLLWIPLRQRPGLGHAQQRRRRRARCSSSAWRRSSRRTTRPRAGRCCSPACCSTASRPGSTSARASGPGPRDGLMTGLAARGMSLRAVRTGIELTVLAAGIALGGTVGIGTLLYALAIGPLAHVFVPAFTIAPTDAAAAAARPACASRSGSFPLRRSASKAISTTAASPSLVVVRALLRALLGRRVDLLDLLDELQARLVELLPALGVELERGAREVRLGAVEAALGRRLARVLVDHLQRRAERGLLGDRRRLRPRVLGDHRALAGAVVVLDRAAHARLVGELDQARAGAASARDRPSSRASRRATPRAATGSPSAPGASRGCAPAAGGSAP